MRRGRKASRWLISPRAERPALNIRVTSVPPDTSSNVAVSVISPKKAGSVVTKLTASTIPAWRRQFHEPHVDHVLLSDVLPRKARSSGG
jgi:hypothetical protein